MALLGDIDSTADRTMQQLSLHRLAVRWLCAATLSPPWLPLRWRHPLVGYVGATGITLASLVLSSLLMVSLPGYRYPFALGFLAILGIAVTWGAGPAALATVLASIVLNFYVMSPQVGWTFQGAGNALGFAVFLLVGLGIGQLAAHVAARRLALQAALARLQALQAVSDAALTQLDQRALLRLLLARIRGALQADNAAILLLDEAEGALIVYAAQGPEEEQIGQVRVPVGQGVAGRIAATRQPLIVADLRSVWPVNPLLQQMASLMGVPLLVEDRLLGVMHVDSATPRQFTDDDLHLLQLVAGRVALALDNARLYQDALEARDQAKQLARQVQADRDRWRQVLDVLPVGVVLVDADGRVEMLNQVGRDIVDLATYGQPLPAPGDAAAGSPVRQPGGTPDQAQDLPLRRSLLFGEEIRDEQQLQIHGATGRETPVLVNSAPLRDAGAGIVGAVAVFQDITALRELERAREEFLSSAAHDLKNPLTAIRGLAQLAQRRLTRQEPPDAAAVLAQLVIIQERTDAMLAQINELEDVTRQQMGGALDLYCTPTDLIELVRECSESHRAASGRTIHLEVQATHLQAEVDAARMGRVVGNLLDNAIKYSPEETPIWVRVACEEEPGRPTAVIAVRDDGIGIPAADLPYIFDRFRRASNVASHIHGTGIGLASVRGIVEQHGGRIAVESVEGKGSTFTVRLPLARAALASDGASPCAGT